MIFLKSMKSKLNKASTIVFSPGPGSPKDYPLVIKDLQTVQR